MKRDGICYVSEREHNIKNHEGYVNVFKIERNLWGLSVGKSMTLDTASTKRELIKKYNL